MPFINGIKHMKITDPSLTRVEQITMALKLYSNNEEGVSIPQITGMLGLPQKTGSVYVEKLLNRLLNRKTTIKLPNGNYKLYQYVKEVNQ